MKKKTSRLDRHERLMQARILAYRAANIHDHSSTQALREGVDYLFYAVDLLVHEVEELRRKCKTSLRKDT